MDLSRPITTVITTLDGPVLTVLARTTQPLTGRKVHQLVGGGSETGIRNALRRLATTGLVSATEVGASTAYLLNRDHLAAPAVLELADLRRRLIVRIQTEIEATWSARPLHASLFGSVARGDGDLRSDIDLLVVHEFSQSPPDWDEQLGSLAEQVQLWTGNHLQTYALTSTELLTHITTGEPIVKDWLRDCVTVFGPDFRNLRRQLTSGAMPQ
ncbi:nucleotidyltransferase-like protein [Kribbella amoyensis]|uniref:Nucleotidyltransferase-like protein n=2 Tax=Kribbella amoyensis TaxID=996641 RepID=A0A561BP60_9ACTN|nr:nucleotidyltransferase-like protein [Kribbella amoyensis]